MTSRLLAAAAMLVFAHVTSSLAQPLQHFITRAGDRLMEGPAEFRFISWNIPNLHYVEDNLRFDATNPWRLPDEYEIRDGLESVRQAGGRVVRLYTLSVRRAQDDPGIPRHVLGPGAFNEDAFRALDMVLRIANETGVRVIIPFVDQWSWWGGISEYAGFRGRPAAAFWTDPQVIADFRRTVAFVLNRRNTYTGTLYKDDKAVLAWETGNELSAPYPWTRDMAAYIKSLAPSHLVIDGFHAGHDGLRPEPLDDPNIDIISTHHYPDFAVPILDAVREARRATAGRKAYIVGEFGFMPTTTVRQVLDEVIANGASGALGWSLRVRNREGGFYWHSEPAGGGLYKAYHWPGFPTGDAYDATGLLTVMRDKAFEIQGVPTPPPAVPAPPTLLPIAGVHAITWQGSTGATAYEVERASTANGPWTLVGAGVDDTIVQYRPLFSDTWAGAGESYFYRVRATRGSARSEPSNVIGPVRVDTITRVDELQDGTRLFARSGVSFVSGETRKAKEDMHRVKGGSGATLVYRTREPLRGAVMQVFFPGEVVDPAFAVSLDGRAFTTVPATRQDFTQGRGDYGYHGAIRYTLASPPAGQYFLRVSFATDMEVGRVEIEEDPGR